MRQTMNKIEEILTEVGITARVFSSIESNLYMISIERDKDFNSIKLKFSKLKLLEEKLTEAEFQIYEIQATAPLQSSIRKHSAKITVNLNLTIFIRSDKK